jgi:hypothetical protein
MHALYGKVQSRFLPRFDAICDVDGNKPFFLNNYILIELNGKNIQKFTVIMCSSLSILPLLLASYLEGRRNILGPD